MELPQNKLILAGLPDILNQPAVVDVRAVVPNAVRLFHGRRSGAEGLDNFPVALAPVAGGQSAYGEDQREQVQGERERGSPPPVHAHDSNTNPAAVSPVRPSNLVRHVESSSALRAPQSVLHTALQFSCDVSLTQ